MTAIEMNAELLRNMSIIAEDENLLKRAAKYLRKLVAEVLVKGQRQRVLNGNHAGPRLHDALGTV